MPRTQYLPLSLFEREEISVALIEDREVSWAVISRRVGRCATTIAREVELAGGRSRYRPAVAHEHAAKRRARPRERLLSAPGSVRERVTAELRLGRSPVAIHADMAAENHPGIIAVETIYSAVYAGILDVKPVACLRMRRPRRRSRQTRNSNKRPALPNISLRPGTVNDRSEPGHWEADHIIGKANRSAMMSLTERMSRYSFLITMPEGYDAAAALAGLVFGLEQIPSHLRRSITFDQGSEWAHWETLAVTYNLDVWFCDPHSPWQRGQVENLNRQWRWWFPRGTELGSIPQHQADHTASIINNQRRRSLNNQTPTTIYNALTLH
jgi:transposase, IS30 family